MEGEGAAVWQGAVLGGILFWIVSASYLDVTRKLRSFFQPWVSHHVETQTSVVLKIQSYGFGFLDALFSGLSCVVSVPFYTGFLPLLFWSGHGKLARQMTLLMAFCDYLGNCIKDVVSAPRPASPPVKRVTATKDEEENALEYGLPSSHTLNTVCLSGYLLHYVLTHTQIQGAYITYLGISLAFMLVLLIGLGRIYLGMHSVVDVLAGLLVGLVILAFWLTVHEHIDSFVISGQNVTSFWAVLSFLLLFAYPTPELPTPSFEFHTAFNGVALGIVAGVQQTYHQFHHGDVPRLFSSELSVPVFAGRMLVGIPTILTVKFCSKALAKWTIPMVANTLGIPIKSTSYIPTLNGSAAVKKTDKLKQGYLQKLLSRYKAFDVDTGIRFLQYAGLAWSVVDLVPSLFSYMSL
ncbi:lipid phosphate phosphatase delta isoform X1 [Vigna radiata var. radiata]|uniref:Lipid phosphate phosphatase delta isoform X1 n=1 Tax=Vigna radiata var. radiata TaxID=3916 RepID=A0A1S3TPM1_VIGRR|nr:lipid phosphate phosphatase delta isoform X1 [Vigna radiata var. radiata]